MSYLYRHKPTIPHIPTCRAFGTHSGGAVTHTASSADTNYDGYYNAAGDVLFSLAGDTATCTDGKIFGGGESSPSSRGHCFKMNLTSAGATAARAYCEAWGGYLTAVESDAENAFVQSLLPQV
jgi:hypothetical protein